MTFDREKLLNAFHEYYYNLMGEGATQAQVDGLLYLVDSFESQLIITSVPQIAYCLATVAHETAWKFKPIKEFREKPGAKGRANQDRYWKTGFYGRGYVQLTWKENYEAMSNVVGIDLVKQPDAVLVPHISFFIMIHGMAKGMFTGKRLSDYINGNKKDYINARRIINGTNRARDIANIAFMFEKGLVLDTNKGQESVLTTTPQASKPNAEPTDTLEQTPLAATPLGNTVESGLPAIPVSKGSIVTAIGVGAMGVVTWLMSFISENIVVLVAAVILMVLAVFYWHFAKQRQKDKQVAVLGGSGAGSDGTQV